MPRWTWHDLDKHTLDVRALHSTGVPLAFPCCCCCCWYWTQIVVDSASHLLGGCAWDTVLMTLGRWCVLLFNFCLRAQWPLVCFTEAEVMLVDLLMDLGVYCPEADGQLARLLCSAKTNVLVDALLHNVEADVLAMLLWCLKTHVLLETLLWCSGSNILLYSRICSAKTDVE